MIRERNKRWFINQNNEQVTSNLEKNPKVGTLQKKKKSHSDLKNCQMNNINSQSMNTYVSWKKLTSTRSQNIDRRKKATDDENIDPRKIRKLDPEILLSYRCKKATD